MSNAGYGNHEGAAEASRAREAAETSRPPAERGPKGSDEEPRRVATPGDGAGPSAPPPGDDVDPGVG